MSDCKRCARLERELAEAQTHLSTLVTSLAERDAKLASSQLQCKEAWDHRELPAGAGELRHQAYLAALEIAVDMHGDKWDAAIDAAQEQP